MKKFQKFILPGFLFGLIFVIYFSYFSPQRGLDSFGDIDPDSHAQKEIKVKLLLQDGFEKSSGGSGKSLFYVQDRNGRKVMVETNNELPAGFEQAEFITIVGHFHQDIFEAVQVVIE